MTLKIVDTGVRANRFEADEVAKQRGGRLIRYAELDKLYAVRGRYKGKYGTFWAREWAVKGVLIEKGKDLVDKNTGVLVPYSDIEKANKARIESGKSAIVGVNGVFLLIDPEAFSQTLKSGLYALENPKITVVENAVLEWGVRGEADPETKITVYAEKPPSSRSDTRVKSTRIDHNGVVALGRRFCDCCCSRDVIHIPSNANSYVLVELPMD